MTLNGITYEIKMLKTISHIYFCDYICIIVIIQRHFNI